jgi:hypothetical protein
MNLRAFIITFLFFSSTITFSKEYELKINTTGNKSQKAYLTKVRGFEFTVIDSVEKSNNFYLFKLKPEIVEKGVYKLRIGKDFYNTTDVLFNNEDIEANVKGDSLVNIEFSKSVENIEYRKFYLQFVPTSELLGSLLNTILLYPKDDDFYPVIEKEYKRVYNLRENLINDVVSQNLFASDLIEADIDPIPELMLPVNLQKQYLITNHFNNLDFSKEDLINSEVIPRKVFKYFNLTGINRADRQRQEAFMKQLAVDLMYKAQNNYKMLAFLSDMLQNMFKPSLPGVYYYVKSNYEMQQAPKLQVAKVGQEAPGIDISSLNLPKKDIKSMVAAYKLIYFFTTNSKNNLKTIDLIKSHKTGINYEYLLVNLDRDAMRYIDYKTKHSLPKNLISEKKSFETKAAIDYGVYAAPLVVIMDEDNKIVYRDSSLEKLKEFFEKNIN